MSAGWWVAQTAAGREAGVSDRLKEAGFLTYLPVIAGGGRSAALFPGYLMVQPAGRWYPVRWTPGVTRVLMSGDQPARLPDRLIAELRSREVAGRIHLPRRPSSFTVGQYVRIRDGVFIGLPALYEGQSSRDRIQVLVELLGQMVPVDLDAGQIEALSVASR